MLFDNHLATIIHYIVSKRQFVCENSEYPWKNYKRNIKRKQTYGKNRVSSYICNVIFFIVLDLRLTKVGVQRYSFFYTHTFRYYSFPSLHHTNSVSSPYQVRTKSKCIDMELIRSRQGFDYIQRIKSKWPLRSCILST